MSNSSKPFICALAALLAAASVSYGQEATAVAPATAKTDTTAPATATAVPPQASADLPPITLVQASTAPAPHPVAPANAAATPGISQQGTSNAEVESGGVGVREFQGDDVGQVLRLLARQAKINMVVSEAVTGTVTMRLEDVTAMQAIGVIVKAKGLFMDKIDNVYYVKTAAERTAEPTEAGSYQFSYARAKEVQPLIDSQLTPGAGKSQIDERTNSIFFRETRSNIDNIRNLLVQIDKPTKQVMIEARLVEVNANPRQSYGINWAGVVGSSSTPQTIKFGGSTIGTNKLVDAQNVVPGTIPPVLSPRLDANGIPVQGTNIGSLPAVVTTDTGFTPQDFLRDATHGLSAIGGQFAILSAPALSVTLRLLNEDADAEFLANPRVVTADNMQAKIEIIRNQPVPQLNFNEQTATAVFGGFEDKKFGNTLIVRPSVNKDNFITLSVKPEISNKVADATFVFAGATVASPIIDTRTLDSNVLIKSGDTLAIGGLLQDETSKARTKVPIMGDIPVLGYLFQEHLNARTKRNLLVFVTPTILEQHYGTGLEDQVSGLHHSGEEFADPNGWRNNAKGAVRLVPTSNRQIATDYPKPGIAPPPSRMRFMSTAKERDF